MVYQWIYFGRCRDLTGPMVECNGINHPLDVCLKIGDTIGYPIEKSHLIHGLIGDTTFSDKPKDWLVIMFCHIRDAVTQWLLSDYYISRRVETTPKRKMIRLDVLVQKFHSKQLTCVSSGEFDQQKKKKQVFITVDPAKNGANGNGSCTSQSADRFRKTRDDWDGNHPQVWF